MMDSIIIIIIIFVIITVVEIPETRSDINMGTLYYIFISYTSRVPVT